MTGSAGDEPHWCLFAHKHGLQDCDDASRHAGDGVCMHTSSRHLRACIQRTFTSAPPLLCGVAACIVLANAAPELTLFLRCAAADGEGEAQRARKPLGHGRPGTTWG